MNLQKYWVKLGWSKAKLAHEADIRVATVIDAEKGKNIYRTTAGKIANALSNGLGYEITYKDIEGFNFAND